jgi:hypothetical protein
MIGSALPGRANLPVCPTPPSRAKKNSVQSLLTGRKATNALRGSKKAGPSQFPTFAHWREAIESRASVLECASPLALWPKAGLASHRVHPKSPRTPFEIVQRIERPHFCNTIRSVIWSLRMEEEIKIHPSQKQLC